jgi:hypothetical protein
MDLEPAMRLVKQADGQYAVLEISRLQLARLQLALITSGMEPLRAAPPDESLCNYPHGSCTCPGMTP